MPQFTTRTDERKEFATEAAIVECFMGEVSKGRTSFRREQITKEWDHTAGFVDVLARHRRKSLVAFEAKLDNWKRAAHQAYRRTAYANKSYVIVPAHVAARAIRDRNEFELWGVGLCSFDWKSVQVRIEAPEQDALLAWLRAQAHEHFDALNDERAIESGRRSRRAMQPARV
jgi:hypothetical protein